MMTESELYNRVSETLQLQPTKEQEQAVKMLARFMAVDHGCPVMIMRGAAGTGKTSVAGAFVKTMTALGQKVMLLAPTGRAAKVFALNSGHAAYTIHRKIYRQLSFTGQMTGFLLGDNLHHDTLFIIDEASMIANEGDGDARFGSGRLLDDLVQFVYSGQNCRMLLIGDTAQLPPVGEEESPALNPDFMAGYGLHVFSCQLDEVLRQGQQSGILFNATVVRRMIGRDGETLLPKVRFEGFADIRMVPGDELIESLDASYSQMGYDETIVLTRSNKRANIYNQGIRNSVLGREEELSSGDMLMVVRNNYYWTEQQKVGLDFLANGDRARVRRVRNYRNLYGLRFADVSLVMPDYDDREISCTVVLDSLRSDSPSLTREQSEALFQGVSEDYADISSKHDRMMKIRDDAYYNALQVKYAYAVTCHKAQGGQWEHVYVDQGYMTDDMVTPDYLHWLYTAFTRATNRLFLVNWPKTQTIGG